MKKFIILIPVYNDWKSVSKLLKEIDLQIVEWESEVSVLIINDASTEAKSDIDSNFKKIKLVKILNMKKKSGSRKMLCHWVKIYHRKGKF